MFSKDGQARQQLSVIGLLVPLPEGWQGANSTSPPGAPNTAVEIDTCFGDGTARRSETAKPSAFSTLGWWLTDDPMGGSLLVQTGPDGKGGCARRGPPDRSGRARPGHPG